MDRPQARLLLRKINQLFDAVDTSSGPLSRIEQDLLMDYTRQFYGLLREESRPEKPTVSVHVPSYEAPVAPAPEPAPAQPKAVAPPTPTVFREEPAPVAAPEPRAAAPVVKEPVAETVATVASVQTPAPAAVPEPVEEQPVEVLPAEPAPVSAEVTRTTTVQVETTVRHTANGHSETDVLFAMQQARDLSDKLRLSRIDDLSRAMGINERFLTINELFGGDHEAFDRTLRALNDLSSFQQARAYLESEVIPRYGWLDERKHKKALVFIQLVQRRFV